MKQTLSTTKWVLGIYFKNYPLYTTVFFICEVIISLSNLLNAYIVALVTDMAISLTTSGSEFNFTSFTPIIFLILGTYIFTEIIHIIDNHIWWVIRYRDPMLLRKALYERLFVLGIAKLEDPETTNKSQRFTEQIGSITDYLGRLANIAVGITGLIGASIILLNSVPVVIAAFAIAASLQIAINQKFIRLLWVINRDTTEERRKSYTSASALMDPKSLKELVLTRGHIYLDRRFSKYADWIIKKVKKIHGKWAYLQVISKIADSTAFGLGIVMILKRLVSKSISVGQLTFEIRSLRIFADSLNGVANNLMNLRESAIKLNDVQDIFSSYVPEKDGTTILTKDGTPPEIKLEDVSFSYTNSEKAVIDHLNLIIKPGEKIAIVGENGAGKTTLVKLICRLYKVDFGKITVGGENINDIKISSFYKKMGVLFQDFNTYSHLSVKENIEIGSFLKTASNSSIKEALKKASALDFVNDYKHGLEQTLSERYKGGIRPSTGQWQKIAIARFFFRNAPILILDEPTASIDAQAEAQIFNNIYKFIENKTVIIISHRFATVRNADRIIVLDKGRIVEEGSHDELLKKNGKYAHSFKLQAKGYQ